MTIFSDRSFKNPKIGCFGDIGNLVVLAKLPEPIKTVSFFKKVKIFAYCCHEKTLVIPENEKRNFEKHSFTTEFSHRDTTFSTEIATVLNGWALSFQCFQKRLKFRFSKLVHAIYVYKEISEINVLTRFDSFLTPFWLDLVTKTHWSFLNNKKSFLKIKFSRLNSVCVTQTNWPKTQLFWTRQQSGFSVCEKYLVFSF